MGYVKQVVFALATLGLVTYAIWASSWILSNPNLVFEMSSDSFWTVTLVPINGLLVGLSYALTVVMSKEKVIDLGVIAVSAMIPIAMMGVFGVWISGGLAVSEILAMMMIRHSLATYLNFGPATILMPGIKTVAVVLIVCIYGVWGWQMQQAVNKNGFHLPDSLVDEVIKLMDTSSGNQEGSSYINQLAGGGLSQQLGISQQQLETFGNSQLGNQVAENIQKQTQTAVKEALNKQVDIIIKPILPIFGWGMAAMLGFSALGMLVFPLFQITAGIVWWIFWAMEKTGWVRFETEMRPVKKLVV